MDLLILARYIKLGLDIIARCGGRVAGAEIPRIYPCFLGIRESGTLLGLLLPLRTQRLSRPLFL